MRAHISATFPTEVLASLAQLKLTTVAFPYHLYILPLFSTSTELFITLLLILGDIK